MSPPKPKGVCRSLIFGEAYKGHGPPFLGSTQAHQGARYSTRTFVHNALLDNPGRGSAPSNKGGCVRLPAHALSRHGVAARSGRGMSRPRNKLPQHIEKENRPMRPMGDHYDFLLRLLAVLEKHRRRQAEVVIKRY